MGAKNSMDRRSGAEYKILYIVLRDAPEAFAYWQMTQQTLFAKLQLNKESITEKIPNMVRTATISEGTSM